MDWRVSPCWHFSRPALLSFSSMFVGMRDGSFPHTYPCPDVPLPPSLPQEAKEGEGGQGSPSVLRLHRVFRLNQEIFYYQKEKRKKKSQRPPFLPAPLGQSRLDLWGFPGGWLRAGTLSGKSGGVPCQALRQAHFGLLPSPPLLPLQANHQRWPSPDLRSLGWSLGGWGRGRGCCAALGRVGWRRGSGLWPPLHAESSAPLPQSWAFPSTSCCGDFCSPPQKSVPSSPTPSRAEGGADPRAGRGEGTAGQMGSWAPRGPPGLLVSEQGHWAFSVMAEPLSESTAPLALPLPSPLLPVIGINLGTS